MDETKDDLTEGLTVIDTIVALRRIDSTTDVGQFVDDVREHVRALDLAARSDDAGTLNSKLRELGY